MMEPETTSRALRDRVLGGLAWSTGAAIGLQVSRLAFGVVLARLLTPEEYGIAGMALVFSVLVLGISDVGLGAGLVQRSRVSDVDKATVFWTSLGIGVALAVAGVVLSGPVAGFFGEPMVQPLFAAVSLGFVVTALGRTHAALLQREMAFRAIAVRVLVATLVSGGVGVTLAAFGFGAWALVANHLTNAAVTTVLLWVSMPWRPRLGYSRHSLRDLGGFGINVFGTKVLDYLNSHTDRIVVGRFLGASPLGVYSVACNLVILPFFGLLVAVLDTLYPALARVQDDAARVTAAWIRTSRSLVAIAAPAMLGMALVAPELVRVLLGERWAAAAPILRILALAVLIFAATALGATVLMAIDRTATLLRFSIVETAIVFTGVVIGLRWGVMGVAAGFVVAIAISRSILTWLVTRALDTDLRSFLRPFAGIAQAALTMVAVVWVTRLGLVEADVPALVRLVLLTLTGALVYLPLCAWRSPELLTELRALRPRGVV